MPKTPASKAHPKKPTKYPIKDIPVPAPEAPKPVYRSFRLQKRIKIERPQLIGGWRIIGQTLRIIGNNWKPFLGIAVIYGLLTIILVGLGSGTGLQDFKETLAETREGNFAQLLIGTTLFMYLLGSTGNSGNESAAIYQLFLGIIASLAIIWTLRRVYTAKTLRIRDAFYSGMYPLVPFILVILVIVLQLIPLAAGASLYTTVINSNVANSVTELLLWGFLLFLSALWSFYMLVSSVLALYIVCLPEMQPLQALRTAKQLVFGRRWLIMRRMLFLPVLIAVTIFIIMLPILLWIPAIAVWVFFGLTVITLPIAHSYMYKLYRELL